MSKRFAGKSVLIFGGSTGIGLAAARSFVAEGAQVAITGRNCAPLDAAAKEFGVLAIRSDLADLDQSKDAVARAAQAFGKFDVVFMNAGIGSLAPAATCTPEEWDRCFSINLRGGFFAIQYALPHLVNGGSIIASGSAGAELAIPGTIAYAAAKLGLRAVVRTLAVELLPRRIRVNMVCIGTTRTDMVTDGVTAEELPAMEKALATWNAMGRLAEPEEIARAVLFLASDDASFITGTNMLVEGGALDLGRSSVGGPDLGDIWEEPTA